MNESKMFAGVKLNSKVVYSDPCEAPKGLKDPALYLILGHEYKINRIQFRGPDNCFVNFGLEGAVGKKRTRKARSLRKFERYACEPLFSSRHFILVDEASNE
jgi:hypothetical protein